jgi:hypothetical protein
MKHLCKDILRGPTGVRVFRAQGAVNVGTWWKRKSLVTSLQNSARCEVRREFLC